MAGHLEVLMTAALAEPDRRLSELGMLREAERHQIVCEWRAADGLAADQWPLAPHGQRLTGAMVLDGWQQPVPIGIRGELWADAGPAPAHVGAPVRWRGDGTIEVWPVPQPAGKALS
jgi:hypothetical protein